MDNFLSKFYVREAKRIAKKNPAIVLRQLGSFVFFDNLDLTVSVPFRQSAFGLPPWKAHQLCDSCQRHIHLQGVPNHVFALLLLAFRTASVLTLIAVFSYCFAHTSDSLLFFLVREERTGLSLPAIAAQFIKVQPQNQNRTGIPGAGHVLLQFSYNLKVQR